MARQMKSSGVEWIGDIPEKWDVCKIINCLSSIGSGTTPQGQEYYENEYIPWLNTGDLNDGYIEKTEKSVSEKALSDYSVLKRFDAGSVVVAMYGATVGKLGIVTSSLVTNQACCVMTSNEKLYNKFLFYLFMAGKTYLISLGSGQPNINQNTVKTFDIPFVPLSEQKEIADYLDDRCGKIDDFIAKQKTVIEKLKEYKQSVITEAVIKGLNPAAPMKSSGVEWIGDIPADKSVIKVTRLYRSILGKMVCDKQQSETDSKEKYLSAINVHFGKIDTSVEKEMYFTQNEKELYLVKENDLLVVEGGAGAGGAAVADKGIEKKNYYIQNSIHIVRPYNDSDTRFLMYNIYSLVSRSYIDFICNKATIPHFTKEKLLSIPIVSFSTIEQKEIADYLDAKCAEIDAFIAKKQTVIDKLTEYKKSLIYECVTGKREVA